MAYPVIRLSSRGTDEDICSALIERWNLDKHTDTHVAILRSLTNSDMLGQAPPRFLGLISEGLNDYTTTARGDVGSHVRLASLRATKELWKSLTHITGLESEWIQVSVSSLFFRVLRLAAEKLDRVRSEAQTVVGLALNSEQVIIPDVAEDSHANRHRYSRKFSGLTFSSRSYFRFLLHLWSWDCLQPAISDTAKSDPSAWTCELLAGYVTSADTGNEELVIASRAALCQFCEESGDNLNSVCVGLVRNLKTRQAQDRFVVPTLQIVAFLLHAGLFQKCELVDARTLCLEVQKAAYKSGNVRKIEACIKIYGSIARLSQDGEGPGMEEGMRKVAEAIKSVVNELDLA
jgi:hypothetical protein